MLMVDAAPLSGAGRARVPRLVAAGAAVLVVAATLTGCSRPVGFSDLLGIAPAIAPDSPADSAPAAVAAGFDSEFTYNGSVSLSTQLAHNLELRLDVWAADPRRTQEWYASANKHLGFAVNVYDHAVDEKAVLAQKRRVYISAISITSMTAQTSGVMQSPFTFSADPRTLVPADTLRSDRGLLLNSYQGGLLVPDVLIGQLPADTYGITLEFAMTISVEGTANTESSFQQTTVYHHLPISIFPDPVGTAGGIGTGGQG